MAIDPATAKLIAKAAVDVVTDEEKRKRLLILILAPTIGLLLLIALIVYIITSPFSLLVGWLLPNELTVVEDFQKAYGYNQGINVMSCLITHMSIKDNTCFPAIKTIAKCCSISVNTVKRALDDLVEAGFVVKEARFIESKNGAQSSNLYFLSAVVTEPQPPKTKESAEVVADEAEVESTEDCQTVSFESLAQEEKTQDEISTAQTETLIPNITIPKTQGEFAFSQTWATPKPIMIPP